jgi:lysophospholipase L1-like esterase
VSSDVDRQDSESDAPKYPVVLVLVTIAAIVLMLLVVEAAVRIRHVIKYGSMATIEDLYTVDRTLNLRVPVPGYSSGHISINRLGFRGPEITMPKPADTVRVAYLGASTTWCAEVSGNDYVWPHLVTASLRQAFPEVRFDYVNGGVPGYTIESILKNLQYRVAPLHPDVIVIYEASNNLSGEMRELALNRGIIEDRAIEVNSWPSRYSLLWYLVEKNLRVMTAQQMAEKNQGVLEVDANTLGTEYRHVLTDLVRAAQSTAKLVAVATFSIQPRREQAPERQMRASASALFYMPFVTPATIIETYGRYNEIIREVARDTGAVLIEGENDIPGDPAHFADSVHFTDLGSVAMADRISRSLISNPDFRQLLVSRPATQ